MASREELKKKKRRATAKGPEVRTVEKESQKFVGERSETGQTP